MVGRLMRKKMERLFVYVEYLYIMCFSLSRFSSSPPSFPIQRLRLWASYGLLAARYCQIGCTAGYRNQTAPDNEPVSTGGAVGRLHARHTLVRKGFLKCWASFWMQEKHLSTAENTPNEKRRSHCCLFPPASNQPVTRATCLYFKSFQHFIHFIRIEVAFTTTSQHPFSPWRFEKIKWQQLWISWPMTEASKVGLLYHGIHMHSLHTHVHPIIGGVGGFEFRLAPTLWG